MCEKVLGKRAFCGFASLTAGARWTARLLEPSRVGVRAPRRRGVQLTWPGTLLDPISRSSIGLPGDNLLSRNSRDKNMRAFTAASMPRWLLALLAIVALTVSPVNALAAQLGCASMSSVQSMTMAMPMPAPPANEHSKGCCERDAKACISACVDMCGVVASLPVPVDLPDQTVSSYSPESLIQQAFRPHEPGRRDRPPKHHA